MKEARIGFRASTELRALVEGYGDVSETAQALIILGAAALGADLADLRLDITMLAYRQHNPQLRAQLHAVLNGTFNATFNKMLNTSPGASLVPTLADLGMTKEEVDDPLGSFGFDV